MRKTVQILFFIAVIPYLLLGQSSFKIKGKVTDAKTGEALIGASVILKPFDVGGMTDLNGNYSFDVSTAQVKGKSNELVASYVSYKKKSVKLNLTGADINQNFAMDEDLFQGEEVVITGIASKTSKSIAEVAVGRVAAADLQQISTYGGLSQLVQGKVSGVQLNATSGNVGSGWRFNVRGGGGLNGDGQPIIYVDGTRMDNSEVVGFGVGGQGFSTLSNLNTNDIDKIEFLKGPAAASMYGANGSNGVVLITTKSGSMKKTAQALNIDYRFNYGYNEKLYTYSSDDFLTADAINRQFIVGPIREHYFSLGGGNGFIKYFSSFENRQETGIMTGTSGNMSTVRLNLDAVPLDNLSVKLKMGYVTNKLNRPNNDNIIYGPLGNTILSPAPFNYVAEADIYKFSDVHNIKQFVGSASVTYTPIQNLDINGTIGIDNSAWREVRLFPYGVNFGGLITSGQKSIYERTNTQYTYDFNASYSYKLFDQVDVRSYVGGQFFWRNTTSTNVTGEQYTSDLITSLGAAGKVTGYGEGFSDSKDGGIWTEHNFSYLNQYFLTLGLRRDYASAIGKNAPAITYPKASFALRLDKFDFTPSLFQVLKFRAAYGESGVLPGSLDGIPLLWSAEPGGYGAGAVISLIGNPDIQPERIKEYELGFDAEFLKDFSLEFTYYLQQASNSIVGKVNPPSTGLTASTQPFNVGAAKGWGFESQLRYSPIRTADYNLDFSLIWNWQRNQVTDMGGAQPIFSVNNTISVGMPKFEFYTYKSTGPNFDPATGKYLGSIKSTDRVDLGNPLPNHTGSFTVTFKFLKNFTFYMFTEWALDLKIFNNTHLFANRMGNNPEYNRLRALLGLPEISKGVAPAVTALTAGTQEYIDVATKYASLDYSYAGNYIEPADYFIFRELSLSYDFTELIKEYNLIPYLKGLVGGISVRNLARLTKYSGSDVELNYTGSRTIAKGNDFLTLQTPRTINFWVRIGL